MIRVSIHEKTSLKASLCRSKPGGNSPRVRCKSEVEITTDLPRLIFCCRLQTAEQMFKQVLGCPCLHRLSLGESLSLLRYPNTWIFFFFNICLSFICVDRNDFVTSKQVMARCACVNFVFFIWISKFLTSLTLLPLFPGLTSKKATLS
jgi:hypothetical protein